MKHCILTALILISTSCFADEQDIRCFTSTNTAKPISLTFAFSKDYGKTAEVRYQNGSGAIPVRLVSNKAIDDTGRQLVFAWVWQEVLPHKKSGGRYYMETQGALVNVFTYRGGSRNSDINFYPNTDTVVENGVCHFEKPQNKHHEHPKIPNLRRANSVRQPPRH